MRRRSAVLFALVLALFLAGSLTGVNGPAVAVEAAGPATPSVSGLRVNGLVDPLGIGAATPRLSWLVDAGRRGVLQRGYQIRVASTADRLGDPDVWDSGRVDSPQSVEVRYAGPPLESRTTYHWAVRVWDDQGVASGWSTPATFETGLLDAGEWSGDWIGAPGRTLPATWTDYTIAFSASDIAGALGVYFRGKDTEHAYMWQLSESEHSLRPHVKNGGYSVLPATGFPAGFDFAAEHDYAIEVSGPTITTSVDGTVLDTRSDSTFPGPGIVGFRTSGAETGLVKNVSVTSSNGDVLVDTTFPSGDRTFTGGTVAGGALRVDASGPEVWFNLGDPVPLLRTDFELADKPISRARVYASAEGLYELRLNGEAVGDQELAPGWTAYDKRIQYQTYDVTDLVRTGANGFGAELAKGWYAGRVAMFGSGIWGDKTGLLAELHVDYADGTSDVVTTGPGWRTTDGPRTAADLLDGESYDGRRAAELGDWSSAGYDDAGWQPVEVRPSATARLEPQEDQPVRVTEERAAHRLSSPTAGAYIYDMGQNMVGKARVTLDGEAGQTVRLRFAEVLNPDGSLYTANLRSAKATDYYTFAGSGRETFEPSFTFHGFRYVEVTGVDEAPAQSDVVGVVMGTDGDLTSELSTSSALVNQLHSNIVWGQRGNFLSVPTDTPARDERMGWTGDIDVFARTAVYNMDSQAFLSKWLQDLRDTQRPNGSLPGVAPIIPGRFDGGYESAGWMDAGVHVPWTVWQAYGDTQVIRDNYVMMKKYVDFLEADSTNHIRSTGGYLDWLNLDDPTPADVLDTAFVAKSTREFAQMAAAVGKDADAAAYQARYEAIRKAYQDAFVSADGTVKGDSQTGYILTITNDLVPAAKREALTRQFVETIERRDWHLSTGFLGVDGLLPALSKVGRTDIAYRLLQNRDYPSWGYEIGKGATTIWERWNSIGPDGQFGDVGMNSFNHYAYGAAGEWMYRTMAGVSALEPGYRKILIAPEPGNGIDHATFGLRTPYGQVSSAWQTSADGLSLDVTVPGNATAELRIPTPSRWAVTEGGRPAESSEGVRFVRMDGPTAVFELGSGDYHFAIDRVLGNLGEARALSSAVVARVGGLSVAGKPAAVETAARLQAGIDAAWNAHLAGSSTEEVADVHHALASAGDLDRWLQQRAPAATDIRGSLAQIDRFLSAASAGLVGAVASMDPPAVEQRPGDVVRVPVVIENRGSAPLESVTSKVSAPAGWTVTPVGERASDAAPGQTVTHLYDVRVPLDAAPASVELTGSVSYRHQNGVATLPIAAAINVGPAVTIDSVSVTPASAEAGRQVVVRATLVNRTGQTRTGTAQVEPPAGWGDPVRAPYSLAAGATGEVDARVTVPWTVTEETVQVVVSTGTTSAERRSAPLVVSFVNPPAGAVDHVDLGNAASEQAHGLTASPSSGTNVEAGLTRRYTNSANPGGWFEMDLAVPAGERFVLRMVETYDQAQLKTYDVLIDGVVAHERRYRRTAGGIGSLSYQFVVEPSAATADGKIRVRFQDVGMDYDPSIADVWSVPVT